ncbi:MAG: hypothetical protein KF740_00620 [Ramlibacter sp.]|nr:hypothetical protein [Ramlibacter sp.]
MTLTLSVLLAVSVVASDQVLAPRWWWRWLMAPLSSDTCTISPATMLALVVPEMVCAAVLVMKSVPELPVSAENAMVDMVVVGAVVSST